MNARILAGRELNLAIAKLINLPVFPYPNRETFPCVTPDGLTGKEELLFWATPEVDAFVYSPSELVEQAMEVANQLGLFEDVWLTTQDGEWFCVSVCSCEGDSYLEGDIIQGCATAAEAICNCLVALNEGE